MEIPNISILIVEDQAAIADFTALCLKKAGYSTVYICDNGRDALACIADMRPDLVFLDVHLDGGLDGVDIAHLINEQFCIPFIFLTGGADHQAIDRIKRTAPAGFILKPFTSDDLLSSIQIALHNFKAKKPRSCTESDSVFVKENHRLRRIFYSEILYVKANDNYIQVQTGSEKFVLPVPLKTFEEKLAGKGFIRTHRSYLVNIQKIELVTPKSVYIGEEEIPLSESYKSDLLSKLNLL